MNAFAIQEEFMTAFFVFAAITRSELIGLITVFGLASVIFLSFAFLAAAVFANRTMNQEPKED